MINLLAPNRQRQVSRVMLLLYRETLVPVGGGRGPDLLWPILFSTYLWHLNENWWKRSLRKLAESWLQHWSNSWTTCGNYLLKVWTQLINIPKQIRLTKYLVSPRYSLHTCIPTNTPLVRQPSGARAYTLCRDWNTAIPLRLIVQYE